jgi:hypothetical protein
VASDWFNYGVYLAEHFRGDVVRGIRNASRRGGVPRKVAKGVYRTSENVFSFVFSGLEGFLILVPWITIRYFFASSGESESKPSCFYGCTFRRGLQVRVAVEDECDRKASWEAELKPALPAQPFIGMTGRN